VEDNPDLLRILPRLLEDRGYDTIAATNGKEAVKMAASKLPDLILMNIVMPKMDGRVATHLIRQNPNTRSIPILAVTALYTPEDREAVLQSGCDDYLSKPFTSEQLLSRIENLLKQNSP